uniref:Receptor expression-enhancing protein n=1 Tax=Elaeophora elaphi TaxID=1147741 RepID=A0A158Q781_9BILA
MMDKEEKKTESPDSSINETSRSNEDDASSEESIDVKKESDGCFERESESMRSSLMDTIATIQIIIYQFFIFSIKKISLQIFYAILFLLLAFILLQNFDPLLCTTVSCFYPAYETTRCLNIHKNRARKKREHWLIYWIVLSFFTLQDYYTEWLTRLFTPLLLLKMLFMMLLALPQTGIAELCYYNIVVPTLSIVNDTFVKYNRVCFLINSVKRNKEEDYKISIISVILLKTLLIIIKKI